MDFVFDLETLDDVPTATILSACFIPFVFEEEYTFQELIDKAWYAKLKVEGQNRTVSDDTLDWWLKQPPEVQATELEPHDDDIEMDDFIHGMFTFLKDNGINRTV